MYTFDCYNYCCCYCLFDMTDTCDIAKTIITTTTTMTSDATEAATSLMFVYYFQNGLQIGKCVYLFDWTHRAAQIFNIHTRY